MKSSLIDDKVLKDNYEIFHTDNSVKSTDSPLEGQKRQGYKYVDVN